MKKTLWAILLIFLLGFIWGNSLLSREDSAMTSLWILQLLTPVLEIFLGPGQVSHHFVRKLAHFAKFAVLGFVLYGNVKLRAQRRPWLWAGQLGFCAAFLDESIQIFSGRGPQISDVWLDFSGVLIGILFALLLKSIFFRSK